MSQFSQYSWGFDRCDTRICDRTWQDLGKRGLCTCNFSMKTCQTCQQQKLDKCWLRKLLGSQVPYVVFQLELWAQPGEMERLSLEINSRSHTDCTISKYCHTINKKTQKRKQIQKLKTCNGQPIVQYSNKKHSRMCSGQNHLSSYQPKEQIIGNLLIINCEWPCDWLTISESWVYRIKNIHKCNLSFHLLVNWP